MSSYYTTHSLREDVTASNDKKYGKTKSYNVGNVYIINPKMAKKEIQNLRSNWDYSLLDDNGVIKVGCEITENTVLIGAYMIDSKGNWIDASIVAKNAHKGECVERVHLSKTTPRVAKVLTREVRFPIVGDKFASRKDKKRFLV